MNAEEKFQKVKDLTVGLDDTFHFHCTQCGKCCVGREDIILSPIDVYRIARELRLSPQAFLSNYCKVIIGADSRMPVVLLKSVGANHRCPLLKNNKCTVHKVKPAVCAMFPLGRYVMIDVNESNEHPAAEDEVKYLLQPISCGNRSETHTVREWLSGFDIALEDKAFVRWHQTIAGLSDRLRTLEQQFDPFTMLAIWLVVRDTLYEKYDTQKDFLPQFEENIAAVMELLQDIPRLKALVLYAAGA